MIFFAAGFFFYGQTFADALLLISFVEKCQPNHQVILRNRALNKEGIP